MELSTPTTTSQMYPASTAAAKTSTLAMKPPKGGIPARERKAASIANASQGLRRLRPA